MKGKANQKVNPVESTYHVPVMPAEVVEQLSIHEEGIYVDCTFGGGGHSALILERLGPKGKLIAFDQDADAKNNLPADERLLFIPQNFRYLRRFLKLNGIEMVDGLLADLGISSHQIDEASRGFSTRFNAALDMRMDQRQELTAATVLNSYTEHRLHKIFEQYGEVTNAKTLAKTIVEARRIQKMETIEVFKTAVHSLVKGNPNKYFAQVFQALRMEVNDEMGALKELMEQIPGVLKPGGRAVIITFHSIEDRLVKVFFRDNRFDEPEENPFENKEEVKVLRLINKKPITASAEEQKSNPRSRSAKMRVAEKIPNENSNIH